MLNIFPIPAFDDNYIWCLHEEGEAGVIVVDPGEAEPVIESLKRLDLELNGILVTHHHGDHIGGISALLALWDGIPVWGPADARIEEINQRVAEGDCFSIPGIKTEFEVMFVPGHTRTHIAYLCGDALFCGDTLFAAGCGRVFDGTTEQLASSLDRLGRLPQNTRIYCAHEYTLDNLGFARWVEPENTVLIARQKETEVMREQGQATVPSLLSVELQTNPFMRLDNPVVIHAAEKYAGRSLNTPAEVFASVREWKDKEYD